MSEKIIICKGYLKNGYIFKSFFNFNHIVSEPTVIFLNDKILTSNVTSDEEICCTGHLNGDELNLKWNEIIPIKDRNLILQYDAIDLKNIISGIKVKDGAFIQINQTRDEDELELEGFGSSKDFEIEISVDKLTGMQSISAARVSYQIPGLDEPGEECSLVSVPVEEFKRTVSTFTKLKNGKIKVCFFTGKDGAGNAVAITNDVYNIGLKKNNYRVLGDINSIEMGDPKEPDEDTEINEYLFDCKNIKIFVTMAAAHKEGNIRIYYEPGCNLRISFRTGAFGEISIYLENIYDA